MRPALAIVILAAMNVVLLALTTMLVSHVRALSQDKEDAHLASLTAERAALAAERTRLDAKLSRLQDGLDSLQRFRQSGQGSQETLLASQEVIPGLEGLNEIIYSAGLVDKPKPLEIPLLSPEELEAVEKAASNVPILAAGVLLSGDLEALLCDKAWNPGGKRMNDLTPDESAELIRLVDAYRYFAKIGAFERLRDITLPEVEAMRSAGAYIELPRSEPVPIVEGARLTHTEVFGSSDSMRVYYFYPADSPELYHHEEVCRQRSLETAFQIHRLLGGEASDEPSHK